MNKERRKELNRAFGLAEEIKEIVSSALEGEQEAFDNMPESLQQGERGQKAEEAISSLESAMENIEELINLIDEAQGE